MLEETQYMSFYGMRVHLRIVLPEGKLRSRVMLLSSPLINSFHWRKLVPELTQLGCMAVMIDLPGFGGSDCSMNVPQDALFRSSLLWGVLDEIDRLSGTPASMWHLCAHGSACATILEMAEMYPDSVKSQIHISPVLIAPRIEKSAPDEWFRANIRAEAGFRKLIERLSAYPLDDFIVDRMRAPLMRPGARENFLRMLRIGRRPPECGIGFCPAMALLGGRDPLTDEAQVNDRLAGAETHLLKSAGHFPMETHSKALRDYLRGWIRYNDNIEENDAET